METRNREALSIFERLRDGFYDRLGDFLYCLFIEANNPFGAAEVMDAEISSEEAYIPHPYLDVYW